MDLRILQQEAMQRLHNMKRPVALPPGASKARESWHPDHLPPIAPPNPLSDEMMAEGDLTEERR